MRVQGAGIFVVALKDWKESKLDGRQGDLMFWELKKTVLLPGTPVNL